MSPFSSIKPGEAVITSGHNLPNPYVIRCLGPVFGVDHPEEELLARCYKNALLLAEQHKLDSIAFPSISTGFFGFPFEAATDVVFRTILEILPILHSVKKIRFVLFSNKDLAYYQRIFEELDE